MNTLSDDTDTPTPEQAIEWHRQGQGIKAMQAYETLLEQQPGASNLRHNLGMLRLQSGHLIEGMTALTRAWLEDGGNPEWAHSLPTIGMTLYHHGLWDEARHWLQRAALWGVCDDSMRAALQRCTLRPDLAPEVYDPVQQRTLLRHPPKESAQHVYAIDVVGTCNLRCPTCPVGNSTDSLRPKGSMPLALFQQVLDKIVAERVSAEPEVWLFNWGEPLLHPDLPAMIRAVRAAGLRCHLSSNLNVTKGLREVVQANPHELKISLSAWTPSDYGVSHAGGSLALVKGNLYLLRHWMDQCRSNTHVWVGHHLYQGGEADVPLVKAVCEELGFAHHVIPAFYQPLERLLQVAQGHPVPHDAIIERLLQHPRDYLRRLAQERSADHDCELRFNQTVINHDASVALCCSVYEPEQMLGMNFIQASHAQLEAAKYRHPFCSQCMKAGAAYPWRTLTQSDAGRAQA